MNTDREMMGRTVGAMKRGGKLWIALLGVAIGVVLLLVSGWMGDDAADEDVKGDTAATDTRISMEEYRAALERRVAEVCARVDGVGTVYAVVTLESGFEYVYATDEKSTASGGSYQYILIGSGKDERPIYLTERMPAILGIGVVCEGGMSDTVRRELTGLLSAAFGVTTNKIYITGGT